MRAKLPPKLSVAERKALDHELNKQTLEIIKKLERDLTAMVLYRLHSDPYIRLGKKRLLRFYDGFRQSLRELEQYYEMRSGDDAPILFKILLKSETGIDVDALPGTMFDFEIRIKED